MKSRFLIIMGMIAAIGSVALFVIIDMHESNLEKNERIDELTYILSDESLQKLLDHCEFQRKLTTGEISEKNADGSYNVIDAVFRTYQNDTHNIDNNICEWKPNDCNFTDVECLERQRQYVLRWEIENED